MASVVYNIEALKHSVEEGLSSIELMEEGGIGTFPSIRIFWLKNHT